MVNQKLLGMRHIRHTADLMLGDGFPFYALPVSTQRHLLNRWNDGLVKQDMLSVLLGDFSINPLPEAMMGSLFCGLTKGQAFQHVQHVHWTDHQLNCSVAAHADPFSLV